MYNVHIWCFFSGLGIRSVTLLLFAFSFLLLFRSVRSFLKERLEEMNGSLFPIFFNTRAICSLWKSNFLFFRVNPSFFWLNHRSWDKTNCCTLLNSALFWFFCSLQKEWFALYKKSDLLFFVKKTSNLHEKPKSEFPTLVIFS